MTAARDPDLARGLALLRARAWFEAHEALEAAWRRARGARRAALQGLVHAAVALEHRRRGNAEGARRQWVKARARAGLVDGFDPRPWLEAVERAGDAPPEAWPVP